MKFLKSNVCKLIYRSLHLRGSPNSKTSKIIWERYRKLPIKNCKTQATYVWIDGTGENLRAKTRTMDFTPISHKECPNWDFDGSATSLADAQCSDVILCPIAIYDDPILECTNKIVLCETYTQDGKPTKTNHRLKCMEDLNKVCNKEPMFGFEQEFQLMDANGKPFGWPRESGEPSPLGSYYCSVGANKAWGREIVESLYRCCLYCGVEIAGCNAEDVPSQWEYQIGPTLGIKAADDLWVSRYLLLRIAEEFGISISFHPKLFPNWFGAGCLTNFSTKEMREDGGYKAIEAAIKKLEKTHQQHIEAYDPHGGKDNKLRLTGQLKTSVIDKFSWGIADRTVSVRISKRVAQQQKGYFQDRRPAANADPYKVVQAMVSTVCT